MTVRSAGILLWRRRAGDVEVLIAHMGGPFWARKDEAAWSIPKGEHDETEDPLAAALREWREELGVDLPLDHAALVSLGELRQPSGKRLTAWAGEGDLDPDAVVPGTFTLEWPPKSGRNVEFPEVDRVGWFDLDAARPLLVKGQRELLDRLRGVVA
ncbi:MAG TPA: NUDIX domain-containing protein [Mycobacteriales bacterium]|nr:NUDIX domain-containing protein [Mycobacteriales bacterium]